MKIAVIDTNQRKFTGDMMAHWTRQGHEVKFFWTCHRPYMEWADVLWFDCVDNNLVCATKRIPEVLRGKKVIARAIDIDVWAGHYNNVDWTKVHHLIFIAEHIRELVLSNKKILENVQVHLIPCGVDLDKFSLRANPIRTNDIAVVMLLWHGKGLDLLLQAIAALPEYQFHLCGPWGFRGIETGWYKAYVDRFLSHYDNWTQVDHVADMSAWLEDKTFTLVCSKKEAFSFVAAEGAAKGLRPLVHEFYGIEDVWPAEYRWRTIEEITQLVRWPYEPSRYREYIAECYPLRRMLDAIDSLIGD